MPSTPQTRNKIAQDIQKTHGPCDNFTFYDLGSGYGGMIKKLSKNFPNASIYGFEISPIPYVISRIFNIFRHSKISRKNIFSLNLGNADVIICYLSNYHMKELSKKITEECRKGTIIYSQGFEMPGFSPVDRIKIPMSIERTLFKYIV